MRHPWLVCSLVLACGGAQLSPARVQLPAPAAPRCAVADGTARLLASMKQKVVIDAYVTRGEPKLDSFVRTLQELLQAYKNAGGGKLDYTVIEAKDDAEKTKKAKDDGLVVAPFGLVIHYGADKDVIVFPSPDLSSGLEYWITNKVRELRDKGDRITHRIGMLAGHDELRLSEVNLVPSGSGTPSMLDVIKRNFTNFALVDVDLKGGERAIDGSLEGLIITQPGKDLLEPELRRIDEFVMKGKSLAVFASSVNVKPGDATMSATLSAHGLDKLLDGYGIELRKDVVLDFGSGFRVDIATQGSVANLHFPQILEAMDEADLARDAQPLDPSVAPFFHMDRAIFPFASSLVLHKDRQPGATTMAVVARSSPQSVRKTDDTVDLAPFRMWRPRGEWEQFGVAVDVEGRLRTAFADARGGDAAVQVAEGKEARVFVVASSQFSANPFVRAGNALDGGGGDEGLLQIGGPYADLSGGAAPIVFAMVTLRNTLDWMVDEAGVGRLAGRVACGGK